jgi:hypothetical protein
MAWSMTKHSFVCCPEGIFEYFIHPAVTSDARLCADDCIEIILLFLQEKRVVDQRRSCSSVETIIQVDRICCILTIWTSWFTTISYVSLDTSKLEYLYRFYWKNLAKVTDLNQFSLAMGHRTTAKVDDWYWWNCWPSLFRFSIFILRNTNWYTGKV